MIDLHIHSTYSDGTKTVEEILEQVLSLGLSQFSITDHNTFQGSILAHHLYPEGAILGTELSVGYFGKELHLLGYFPHGSDFKNVSFIIDESEIRKRLSVTEMVERLNKQGYKINVTELNDYGSGVINRVHICRALMAHGYIESVAEGFAKLVGDNCPAYVPREYVTIEEAAKAIHQDGGIAVIAHPFNYKHISDVPKMLDDIIDLIDGVECLHPSTDEFKSNYLKEYASSHNKIITGGSDFHGDNKPNISLGMMNVPDDYMIKK